MGTQTTSIPTPGSGGISNASAGTFSDDAAYSFPQNGYVDKVHVYAGAQSGTTTLTAVVYRTTDGAILATSSSVGGQGAGHAWVTCPLPSNLRLTSGQSWAVGIFGTPTNQVGNNTGTGHYWWSAGSSPATRESGIEDQRGFAGQLFYYLEYFPDATITSVDAGPFPVGGTFHVHGTSFSSGVSTVKLNGTTCPTFSVDSDTQLTVTVPSGATSGHVQVSTNAGTVTSSGSVTVSQAYGDNGTTWAGGVLVYADNGSAWVSGTTVWADTGAGWVQIG